MSDQKEEVKEEIIQDKNINIDNSFDMFVDPNQTFEITIKYQKNNNTVIVEDGETKIEGNNFKVFTTLFRFPTFQDYQLIHKNTIQEGSTLANITQLQYSRMELLVKSWTLDKPIIEIKNLHPQIIKAILNKILEVISLDGII